MKKVFILSFISLALQSCFLFDKPTPIPDPPKEDPLPSFVQLPDLFPIQPGKINEASGLEASTTMSNTLWVNEDASSGSFIHAISTSGQYLGKITFPPFNRDWEDIAIGPGPENGVNYMYIAETGDNLETYGNYTIYRLKEPTRLDYTETKYEIINFKYSDNKSYDTEAMFIDPTTKDIYLITKRQFNVNVFRIAYPQINLADHTAEFLGTIQYSFITAADISADGKELLLKNYDAIYYWRRKENESIYEALKRTRDIGAPYQREPQGEAICFDKDSKGYYTLSEIAQTTGVNLSYYGQKIKDN